MARKSIEKTVGRGARGPPDRRTTAGSATQRKSASPPDSVAEVEALRKELAAARARIAKLERAQAEVLRRLEAAIEAMHSLLEN